MKAPDYIDPYLFQTDWNKRYTVGVDGWYTMDGDVILDLKCKPKSGAAGDGWVLSDSGQLLLCKGYRWNGANVVQDANCKMLSSAVHDVLCQKECLGQYGYIRRQLIYRDIMKAQGGGWLLSNINLAGTVLGQWFPWPF
jgi:hypothetical protein